jgi:hypothetical protein
MQGTRATLRGLLEHVISCPIMLFLFDAWSDCQSQECDLLSNELAMFGATRSRHAPVAWQEIKTTTTTTEASTEPTRFDCSGLYHKKEIQVLIVEFFRMNLLAMGVHLYCDRFFLVLHFFFR